MHLNIIRKPLKLIAGSVLFIIGVITAPAPLPIGQFFALVGLSLLISESSWVKVRIQKLRRRVPFIGQQLQRVRPHLPKFLKKVIDDTDPGNLKE
jgi:hypothetical protein